MVEGVGSHQFPAQRYLPRDQKTDTIEGARQRESTLLQYFASTSIVYFILLHYSNNIIISLQLEHYILFRENSIISRIHYEWEIRR
jgi:hypothetical protein